MKTKYICKCGRVVEKSTTADNTGNRDTAGCEGCPYLLPWGPDEYVAGQGFVKNVKGHECRMSPTLEYCTELHGRLDDKTTIRITSLDFDFVERVSDWVKEHYPNGELSGGFSRDRIRAVEYVDQGRYRYTLACSQNKKGIAAKRALWAEFFDESFHRKDMDADEEKRKILRDIERGKAAAQRKENKMQTDDHGTMTDAGELLENGTECRRHAVSRVRIGAGKIQAIHVCDDQPEGVKIWLNAYNPAEYWVLSKAGEIGGEHIEGCPYCAALLRIGCGDVLLMPINREPKSNKPPEPADSEGSPRPNPGDVYRSAKGGRLYKIGEGYDGKKTYYRTMRYDTHNCIWEPANGSLYPELSNAQGEFEAWIRTEQLEPVAPNGDAAANTAANAAQQPQPEETPITPTNASSSSDPACPADAGAATQSLSAAGAASLAAEEAPAFDFSALGDLAEKAVEADKQFDLHYGRAQDEYLVACIYLARIHALTAKAGRYGGGTWTAWYQSKGISEGSARTMVQNGDSFKSATVAELKNLPAITKKDLNLIARQGAAEQVLEAAKESDSARIQEIVAQLKAEREAREQIEQQLADAQREHQAERESTSALLRDEQQRRQEGRARSHRRRKGNGGRPAQGRQSRGAG